MLCMFPLPLIPVSIIRRIPTCELVPPAVPTGWSWHFNTRYNYILMMQGLTMIKFVT